MAENLVRRKYGLSLGAQSLPFPSRLAPPAEFAQLVVRLSPNPMLNGESDPPDGASGCHRNELE